MRFALHVSSYEPSVLLGIRNVPAVPTRPVSRGHELGMSPSLSRAATYLSGDSLLVPRGVLNFLVLRGYAEVVIAHIELVFPCPWSEPPTQRSFRLASGPLVACCTNTATMAKVPLTEMRGIPAFLSV